MCLLYWDHAVVFNHYNGWRMKWLKKVPFVRYGDKMVHCDLSFTIFDIWFLQFDMIVIIDKFCAAFIIMDYLSGY